MTDMAQSSRKMFIGIRWKMLVIFLLVFTIIFAGSFYYLYTQLLERAIENLERELSSIAERTASQIDGDAHQSLFEDTSIPDNGFNEDDHYWGIEDQRYRDIVDTLFEVQQLQGTVVDLNGDTSQRIFAYTYVSAETEGDVRYVGSTGAKKLDPEAPPTGAKFRLEYTPQSPQMRDGLTSTQHNVRTAIEDEFGVWYSAFSPIRNSDGDIIGAVGIDMRDTTIQTLRQQMLRLFMSSFGVTLVIVFALVWLVSYSISRPIIALTRSAEKVAEGDYSEAVLPDFDPAFPDESTRLTEVFELMVSKVRTREESLKQEVAQLKIEIDRGKQQAAVDEIVESDFFSDLQKKAKDIRSTYKEQDQEE